MDWSHIDGALIWSIAIIAGPIILGIILAYATILRRRTNMPDKAAPEYQDKLQRSEGDRR